MWHKKLVWMYMDTKYGGVEWRQSLTLQTMKRKTSIKFSVNNF